MDNAETHREFYFDAWDEKTPFGAMTGIAAERFGDREALLFRDQRFTFADIDREVDRVARGLMAIGVEPGDKVCVWLNNCPQWVFLMFALAKIGAVQIPVNTRFRTDDARYIFQQSDCALIIAHEQSGPIDYLSMLRELLPESCTDDEGHVESEAFPALKRLMILSDDAHSGTLHWSQMLKAAERVTASALARRSDDVDVNDTLLIMYTSGTTGFPKGVMRNHSLIRNHVDRIRTMQTTPDDVFLNYLPLFHIFGFVDGPLLSIMAGNRQILTVTFDPAESMDLIEREGVTQAHGFETHLKALMDEQQRRPRDISSLRLGIFAAGMNSATPVKREAADVLAPMKTLTAYGMTEVGANGALSFLDSSEEQRCETSGFPCPGFEYKIIDPQSGDEQPTGVPGEILVKSYNLMQGYYRKPRETADAYDTDGWFHSGDMGYLRPDGYLRFLGRYKDMLKIGGENVDPMEVEGYLLTIPGIRLAAVVGFPDPRLTEVAVAFVVADDSPAGQALSPEAVHNHCAGRIASFKAPKHVLMAASLPMTSTGKIQKVKLRDEAMRRIGEGESAMRADATSEESGS